MSRLNNGRLILRRDAKLSKDYAYACAKRKVMDFDDYPVHVQKRMKDTKRALIKFFNLNENARVFVCGDYVTGKYRDKEMYVNEKTFAKIDAQFRTFNGRINASTRLTPIDFVIVIDDKIYEAVSMLRVGTETVNVIEKSNTHTVLVP